MKLYGIMNKQLHMQDTISILSRSSSKLKSQNTFTMSRDSFHLSAEALFGSVALQEEDVKAYYGTAKVTGTNPFAKTKGSSKKEFSETVIDNIPVELPQNYEKLKECGSYYYHGENISDYKLVQIAVASGKMEVNENISAGSAVREAFKVLIEDESKTKYNWSTTKYSEDGKYTFTLDEDGSYKMHLLDDQGMQASLDDIANWICSGTPNSNIETRYLWYLREMDPDLYDAAQNIGREIRNYDLLTVAYSKGALSEAQHDYDLNLLALLFGRVGNEEFYTQLQEVKKTGDYSNLLESYRPTVSEMLMNLRNDQITKTGGII